MDIIRKNEAAKRAGISRQLLRKKIITLNPDFVVKVGKEERIDTTKESWLAFAKECQTLKAEGKIKAPKRSAHEKKPIGATSIKKAVKKITGKNIEMPENPDIQKALELAMKAEIAMREQEISKAKIAEQKAIQEELKTLQLKKELAPLHLVEFFFSFSENLIQRIYRRPIEIEADLESLYMAGKKKLATQKLIRELESIIKDVQKELIDSMKKEGYKK
jgi:hypothetical protein